MGVGIVINECQVDVADRVCQVLGCQPGDIMEHVPDEPMPEQQTTKQLI
ncbi:MAG TPA: helix-turn-helix transcriptional regulator [Epulopiscium sp.]|nr:helix-turn-helix transcriptional regulator [Candidatus Epulonipiscium sp.]